MKPSQNILITVDAVVFSQSGQLLQVLLIKRKNDPCKDMWAFPGGFVEDNEELEAAALRELEEETGVKVPEMEQLHTFGKIGRDPRSRTVSVVYYTFTEAERHNAVGADDASDAQWVNVNDINELAFDHMDILRFAQMELGNRMSLLIS